MQVVYLARGKQSGIGISQVASDVEVVFFFLTDPKVATTNGAFFWPQREFFNDHKAVVCFAVCGQELASLFRILFVLPD